MATLAEQLARPDAKPQYLLEISAGDVLKRWIQVVLPAPASPAAARGGAKEVVLTWSAVTGATGYKVYRGTVSGSLSLIDTLGAVTTTTDTAPANNTRYYYAVTAIDATDESSLSVEVSAKTWLAYALWNVADTVTLPTMESGQTWINPGWRGTAGEIISNCFAASGGGLVSARFDGGVADNITLESAIGADEDGTNGRQVYLTARGVDANNFNICVYGNIPTAQVLAYKQVATVYTLLGSSNRTFATGERAGLNFTGNVWTLSVDGVTEVALTDAANNAGTVLQTEVNNAGAKAADFRVYTA